MQISYKNAQAIFLFLFDVSKTSLQTGAIIWF